MLCFDQCRDSELTLFWSWLRLLLYVCASCLSGLLQTLLRAPGTPASPAKAGIVKIVCVCLCVCACVRDPAPDNHSSNNLKAYYYFINSATMNSFLTHFIVSRLFIFPPCHKSFTRWLKLYNHQFRFQASQEIFNLCTSIAQLQMRYSPLDISAFYSGWIQRQLHLHDSSVQGDLFCTAGSRDNHIYFLSLIQI